MYLSKGTSKMGAVNCNTKSTSWATKRYIKLKNILIENRQKSFCPILPSYCPNMAFDAIFGQLQKVVSLPPT